MKRITLENVENVSLEPSFSLGNETPRNKKPHLAREMHRNISVRENARHQKM